MGLLRSSVVLSFGVLISQPCDAAIVKLSIDDFVNSEWAIDTDGDGIAEFLHSQEPVDGRFRYQNIRLGDSNRYWSLGTISGSATLIDEPLNPTNQDIDNVSGSFVASSTNFVNSLNTEFTTRPVAIVSSSRNLQIEDDGNVSISGIYVEQPTKDEPGRFSMVEHPDEYFLITFNFEVSENGLFDSTPVELFQQAANSAVHVPEPSLLMLLGCVSALLMGQRRQRSRVISKS